MKLVLLLLLLLLLPLLLLFVIFIIVSTTAKPLPIPVEKIVSMSLKNKKIQHLFSWQATTFSFPKGSRLLYVRFNCITNIVQNNIAIFPSFQNSLIVTSCSVTRMVTLVWKLSQLRLLSLKVLLNNYCNSMVHDEVEVQHIVCFSRLSPAEPLIYLIVKTFSQK